MGSMANFKGLIYTMDTKKYLYYDNEIKKDFFISNSLDECIASSNANSFQYIFIDETCERDILKVIEGCNINHKDMKSPHITVTNHKNIFKLITKIIERNKNDTFDLLPQKIDAYLDMLMLSVNVSPKVKGYMYIKHTLAMGLLDDTALLNISKNLYCSIATTFNTTDYSVESAIHFSIKKAFKDIKCEKLNNIFGDCTKIPSNCVFLKRLLIIAKSNIKEYFD